MANGWLGRRRNPRLSGTLHVLDAAGRELSIPLRGRATVLTAGGSGLTGYGEVWAVHTTAETAETSLMISYGRDGSAGERESGLCGPGETVELGGVRFTWREQRTATTPAIPRPREEATAHTPRNLRMPAAQHGNTRAEPSPAGRGRPQNAAPSPQEGHPTSTRVPFEM